MRGNVHHSRYLEKPVTADEQAVARLLEEMEQAIAAHDRERMLSVFSEQAKITILGNKNSMLDKQAYSQEITRTLPLLRRIRFADIFIKVTGMEAKISCKNHIIFVDGPDTLVGRYFLCKKINNRWLIATAEIF